MSLPQLLGENRSEIALIIGNGVNRYPNDNEKNSWESLLLDLWHESNASERLSRLPSGISPTEFFDILEVSNTQPEKKAELAKKFCNLMGGWEYLPHHISITSWAEHYDCPILTTNFDEVLSDSLPNCKLHGNTGRKFTDFYPWEAYFSTRTVSSPENGFAIWHVNGMQRYERSLRLGLSHYMGSVERARNWLHKGDESSLFRGKNVNGWRGANSWLHVFFNCHLLIVGLGLNENEVFLRWLLIERYKYFRKYPDRSKKAWYVSKGAPQDEGKLLFLRELGIETVICNSYYDIYEAPWR